MSTPTLMRAAFAKRRQMSQSCRQNKSCWRITLQGVAVSGVVLLSAPFPASAQAKPQAKGVPPGYSSEIIDVKFRPIANTAIPASLLTPALSGLALDLRPLFSLQRQAITAMRAAGAARSGQPVPDLNLWFRIVLTPGADASDFMQKLKALSTVDIVEPAPLPTPPPATPDFSALQGYAGAAPGGIEAQYSWTFPGGAGAGIKIYDVEYGWNQTHEDLSKAYGLPLLLAPGESLSNPFDNNHGTAVLGELIADKDSKGVTGISWDAAGVGLAPASTDRGYNPANAILLSAQDGHPGDVILVEQQAPVCGGRCDSNQVGCGPSEVFSPVFDAIRTAVANGLVVVEAAGNGNVNLDQPACADTFKRSLRDSGAIIVGASDSPNTATDRQRRFFSTYGSRVDLQGWGHDVTTTGYGDLSQDSDANSWYTARFGGTSSASPIVAGAVANLQGIALQCRGSVLAPLEMRALLVETGSPQLGDTHEHIGPRPDLRRAIERLCSTKPGVPTHPTPGGTRSPGPVLANTTVTFAWSQSAGATKYSVTVRDIARNQWVVNQSNVTTPSLTATLAASRKYSWKVSACNGAGCSVTTTQRYFQTPSGAAAKPPQPTNPSPGSIRSPGPSTPSKTVTFKWGAAARATSYTVIVTGASNNQKLVNHSGYSGLSLAATLGAGKKYYWTIAACNSAGCSSLTSKRYFKTP